MTDVYSVYDGDATQQEADDQLLYSLQQQVYASSVTNPITLTAAQGARLLEMLTAGGETIPTDPPKKPHGKP